MEKGGQPGSHFIVETTSAHVLLEESLRKVLEVPLREGDRARDGELTRDVGRDFDVLTELSSLALNLDVVDEELLVRGGVENLVVSGSLRTSVRKNQLPARRTHRTTREGVRCSLT